MSVRERVSEHRKRLRALTSLRSEMTVELHRIRGGEAGRLKVAALAMTKLANTERAFGPL